MTGDPKLFHLKFTTGTGPEYEVGVTMASQNHNDEHLTGVDKPPFYAFLPEFLTGLQNT